MTDEKIQAFLDSPVGRRAVEAAAEKGLGYYRLPTITLAPKNPQTLDMAKRAVEEALRVATDDTCQTCDGAGTVPAPGRPEDFPTCPNPDCKDGKVTPALVDPMADEDGLMGRILEWHRAQVVAEITQDLAEQLNAAESSRSPEDPPDVEPGIEFAINRIERRERER